MSDGEHLSLLFRKVDVFSLSTRLMNILCIILFILGIIGNTLGLFIFSSSRRTWRISSTYACLAIFSSITNLLCVIRYTFILHSTSRNILRQLVEQRWWACKFYQFSFSFRIISLWITLFWMFERLIYVSTKLRAFFNQWNSYKLKFIIPIIIMSIILSCVIVLSVYMFQPEIIIDNKTVDSIINTTKRYCGLNSNASKYFHGVDLRLNYFTIRCVFSEIIPTGTIILFNSYIIYCIVRTYRRLHQTHNRRRHKKQIQITSWMNIVLILHSSLFLLSLFSHIIGHFIVVEAHETWWISLSILINCSLNFYVYCLSGKGFRNEIRRLM